MGESDSATRRTRGRRRLGLTPDERLALILPPVQRAQQAFTALWGALLAHQVRRDLRIVLAEGGREADRLLGLADAVRAGPIVRVAPSDLPLADLLSAADVALYAPRSPGPVWALEQAAVTPGLPLVISDQPQLRAVLKAHAAAAELCRSGSPREIARLMLRALCATAAPAAAATQK